MSGHHCGKVLSRSRTVQHPWGHTPEEAAVAAVGMASIGILLALGLKGGRTPAAAMAGMGTAVPGAARARWDGDALTSLTGSGAAPGLVRRSSSSVS